MAAALGARAPVPQPPRVIDTILVYHELRVMARKLKNVTVTLDEDAARWARVEAAKRDTSVSRFLGELLRERMVQGDDYRAARDRYFAQEPRIHRRDGRPLPTRDELHHREGRGDAR